MEIDGHDLKGNFVGALGGFFGQMILTLSILEKNFNRQLTSKSTKSKKSSKSGKSKKTGDAKSQKDDEESKKKSAEDEEAKSQKSKAGEKTDADGSTIQPEKEAFDPYTEPTIKEKGWFTKQNIQNFIHFYFSEKMRTEKTQFLVGKSFEQFLANLEKPMALNTGMRLMKEPNYSKFRGLIRDPAKYGDTLLARLFENCDKIGLSQNSYHMIYEGFWDLYCRKPASTDLNAKKLEPWSNLINLKVPQFSKEDAKEGGAETIEAAGEEGEEAKEGGVDLPPSVPVKAVVRVRIPFKKPEPQLVEDEDGNTKEVYPDESEFPKEEIDPEDKIQMLPGMND